MDELRDENDGHVVSLSQDSFYRDLTARERMDLERYSFDHPDAFNFAELRAVMQKLKAGQRVEIPQYGYVSCARLPGTTVLHGASVVLLEGILVFHNKGLRDLFDIKVFVDTNPDTRLARRIRRDIVERGRDVLQVLDRYERSVKPSFEQFILPTKAHADIILPRGAMNTVAVAVIVEHIRTLLRHARSSTGQAPVSS
eukprot:SM000051S17597  [mRNA]  locus=s51:769535:770928:+ [translate_table: standard]